MEKLFAISPLQEKQVYVKDAQDSIFAVNKVHVISYWSLNSRSHNFMMYNLHIRTHLFMAVFVLKSHYI